MTRPRPPRVRPDALPWKKTYPRRGARKKALSYLTRREHSAREVEDYLLRKGYDGDTASSVTGSLRK